MNKMIMLLLAIMLVVTVFSAAMVSMNAPEEARSSRTTGAISHWALDENNGTIAVDSIGNNNGTIIGPNWTAGKFGACLSFDGVDDYVIVSDNNSLDLPDNLTIEAWVFIRGNLSSSASPVVVKSNNYQINIFNDRIRFSTSGGILDHLTTVQLNKWIYIAATFDGSQMKLFINGDWKGSINISSPLVTTANALYMGGYSTYYLNGLIDDVWIRDTPLSAEDIKATYDNASVTNVTAGNHTCQEAIDDIDALIEKVKSYNLSKGTENSFVKKLENAKKSLLKGNHNAALGKLGAFINHAEAQCGKKLTVEQADEIIADAEAIIEIIKACTA
jgi:hypothetical protein